MSGEYAYRPARATVWEWVLETFEAETGDVVDVALADKLADLLHLVEPAPAGHAIRLALRRDYWVDEDDLKDRSYAYVGAAGLGETCDRYPIPKARRAELGRYLARMTADGLVTDPGQMRLALA
jgi:hypothetical protein